jgi:acetyl-CoA C-acetyltransferase
MTRAEDKIAVIIGVGQVNDRPDDLNQALDSVGLMQAALNAAEKDTGTKVLHRLEWLGAVDQISFPDSDFHEHLAARLAHKPATVLRTKDSSGDYPIRLINDAANLIAEGKISVAAVVGGEAMRTANKRAQAAAVADPSGQKIDKLAEAAAAIALPHARPYGLLTPSEIYPIYENATRAAWGQSLDQAQAETGTIWSRSSEVAARNPNAWLRDPVSVDGIVNVTADNRLISFPFTKLMVANNSVNMGAAIIVASLAVARELGVPANKLVYVGRGAAAHEVDDYLRRDSYTHSAGMTATLQKTLEFNGLGASDLDHVELYSCFPCIPKMARRILNWPAERASSVYGGLTFGGAPVGNPMLHAAAAMVETLRAGKGNEKGLVFANGGFATHNHAIVLSQQPGPDAGTAHSYDVHAAADALRGTVPTFLDKYAGPATIESYMMPYNRKGEPAFAAVVGRTPRGERFLAHVPPDDRAMLQFLAWSEGEPVGRPGTAVAMADGRMRWTR